MQIEEQKPMDNKEVVPTTPARIVNTSGLNVIKVFSDSAQEW